MTEEFLGPRPLLDAVDTGDADAVLPLLDAEDTRRGGEITHENRPGL